MLKVVHEPSAEPKLSVVKRRAGEKHQTFFLTIYERALRIGSADEDEVRNTLRVYYLEHRIWNVVAIILRDNGDHRLLTYTPFDNAVICLPPETYRLVDLYFDKARDFMGQPLRVSLFPEQVRVIFDRKGNLGTDYFIAELLASKLNASLIVLRPTDNEEYGNPTSATNASGSLGQVQREEVDISLNSRFLRLDLFYNNNIVEPTVSIGRDDMCVLVPRSEYKPLIYKLWQSLEISVWSVILFITVPYALLVHHVSKMRRPQHDDMTGADKQRITTLDIVRPFLNQSLRRLPKVPSLRILIIVWIMYCFLINNILQSCLTSSLTVRRRGGDVDTITQLSDEPYRIVAATDYARLITRYFNQSGSNQTRLTDKLWPMPWTDYNNYIDASDTRYAYANKYHMTTYYANMRLANGRPMFHAMHECLVPFLGCYIVPFGSPLLSRFNDIISWTEQAGIFVHWERTMNEHPRLMTYQRQRVVDEQEQQSPLPLQTMVVFFYFLIAGLCLSLVAFCAELTIGMHI